MSVLPGAENVDSLMAECSLPGRQRADYLAFNRRVIIEQKSLECDPHDKAQALIEDFLRRHNTIGVEQMSLASIAEASVRLPDGNRFRRKLRQMLTQRIDDVLAKADKHTLDTRKTFVIPEAVGIVVILNDNIQLIEPDFFQDKAFSILRKRLPTGELMYPNNQVVILALRDFVWVNWRGS